MLIPLKIRWAGQASIEMVKDSELLELMRRSGCLGQLVGFDAMNKDALKWLNKKSNLRNLEIAQLKRLVSSSLAS